MDGWMDGWMGPYTYAQNKMLVRGGSVRSLPDNLFYFHGESHKPVF